MHPVAQMIHPDKFGSCSGRNVPAKVSRSHLKIHDVLETQLQPIHTIAFVEFLVL